MTVRSSLSLLLLCSVFSASPAAAQPLEKQPFEALVKLFESQNAEERLAVAEAWGKRREDQAANVLARALGVDATATVRRKCAWALGVIGARGDAAGGALQRAVTDDKDSGVRHMAAWALGRIGAPSASEALSQALRDTDVPVRAQAAKSLGEIGDKSAKVALRGVLGDPATNVRKAAIVALRKLGMSDAELRAALPNAASAGALVAEKKSHGLGLGLGLVGAGLIYAGKPVLGWTTLGVELAGVAMLVVGLTGNGLDSRQVCPSTNEPPAAGSNCAPDLSTTQYLKPTMRAMVFAGAILAAGAWLVNIVGTPLSITKYNERIDDAKRAVYFEPYFELRSDAKLFGATLRF